MSQPNPYQPPPEPAVPPPSSEPLTPQREAYNVVTDLVVGPNIRWKDNLYQAIAILACLVTGSLIGIVVAQDKALGLLAGAGAGLLVGLFGSGIFLMVYRAVRHARGRHD